MFSLVLEYIVCHLTNFSVVHNAPVILHFPCSLCFMYDFCLLPNVKLMKGKLFDTTEGIVSSKQKALWKGFQKKTSKYISYIIFNLIDFFHHPSNFLIMLYTAGFWTDFIRKCPCAFVALDFFL